MNCQEFEQTIIDLDFDHLMEAPTHARALAHAEICAQCAARLNHEQRTTAGLRAFAIDEASINAPERLKLALRVVYNERHAAAASRPVPFSSARLWFAGNKLLWGLAAAAILLLFTITTAVWLREQKAQVGTTPPKLSHPAISQDTQEKPPETSVAVQGTSRSHPPQPPAARPSGKYGRRPKLPVKESAEEAAELFPLTFIAKSGPTEFVQTVRVEISRSTLLLMGLPINIDRGEGLVKADIIISEDGVARAVRVFN